MACKSLYGPCDNCGEVECKGCVKVVDPCNSNAPVAGVTVEVYEPGTSTLLASGTTGADGRACDLKGGLVDVAISKPDMEPVLYKNQTLPCEGLLTLNQRSKGKLRCYGFSCNPASGYSPTTFTLSRTGYPTITGTTGGSGYVDLWPTATGVWNWTATAPKWETKSGTYNYQAACGNTATLNIGFPIPDSDHFCGCSGFANSPHPFKKIATVTTSGGSTSVDISSSGNYCGTNYLCVMVPASNTTLKPTMPGTWCWNPPAWRSCSPGPFTDTGSRSVKVALTLYASNGPTPTGSQTSPQVSKTWNQNCVEEIDCNPENTKSQTWRDATANCSDFVGGKNWSSTGYTIHSYDPPVVELHFDQPQDFGPVAGSTPPPGGPPCNSIILSVMP